LPHRTTAFFDFFKKGGWCAGYRDEKITVIRGLLFYDSSYYYWQGHRQPTAQRLRLLVHAKAVHTETRQTYGSRRCNGQVKLDNPLSLF
jgi:hypothetical protein